VRGVQDEPDVIAEVPAHPRGGLAAVVRGDPAEHERLDLALLKPLVQVRVAVEARVGVLGDDDVRIAGDNVLERVPRIVRPQRRLRLGGVMTNEHDRPVGLPPAREQRGDVGLAFGVVPRTPVLQVIEPLLHVDHEQGGVGIFGHRSIMTTPPPRIAPSTWQDAGWKD
jgi:hypothetical protein